MVTRYALYETKVIRLDEQDHFLQWQEIVLLVPSDIDWSALKFNDNDGFRMNFDKHVMVRYFTIVQLATR